jgi:hypothetical protein
MTLARGVETFEEDMRAGWFLKIETGHEGANAPPDNSPTRKGGVASGPISERRRRDTGCVAALRLGAPPSSTPPSRVGLFSDGVSAPVQDNFNPSL